MRSTWLPIGIALVFPATALLGACGPSTDTTTSTGGGGNTTTTTGGGGTGGATGGATTGGGGIGGTGGTGGTTGGTGGTGGFMPPANDACPGESVALAIGASKSITGTLNGALDDYTTFCADIDPDPGASDVVYQLDVPAASTVTLKTTAAAFVPALSLRKQDCTQRIGGDACINLGAGGGEIKIALDAGTYWVVIDSADGNTGDFTFDVTFAAPACGDGVVNPGETCDPVAISGDDGCINPDKDNGCHFGEAPPDPAIVACPGGLVTIVKNDPIQLGPYSNGSGDHAQANVVNGTTCTSPTTGPENVFQLAPKADGTLTVQIGHTEDGTTLYCADLMAVCADFVMYLRKGACDSSAPGDQLGCADFTLTPDPADDPSAYDELLTITVPVTKDTDYWLIVDGLDDVYGIGPYYLQLSLQ